MSGNFSVVHIKQKDLIKKIANRVARGDQNTPQPQAETKGKDAPMDWLDGDEKFVPTNPQKPITTPKNFRDDAFTDAGL